MATTPRRNQQIETRSESPRQIGIRVDRELGDRLAAIAAREHNGLASVARRLLVSALDAEDAA